MMVVRQALLRQGRTSAPSRAITRATQRRWQTTTTTSTTAIPSRFNDTAASMAGIQDAEFSLMEGDREGEREGEAVQQSSRAPTQRKRTALDVAEEYTEYQRQKSLFKDIGGTKTSSYTPHELINNPPRPSDITLELLLASQSHMGAVTSRWHPANAAYIFGVRDNTHIISLDATAAHLRRACKVVSAVSSKGGLILFAGTRKGQERAVVRAAELAGAYHLFDRWVAGSLTNSTQILGRCALKVVDPLDEEVPGFGAGALRDLPPVKPDLVVCLNPLENEALLRECAQHDVPTVGVVDTDVNPLWVTYPIPANDDSLRCVSLIAGVLGRAGEEGRALRIEQAQSGRYLAHAPDAAKLSALRASSRARRS